MALKQADFDDILDQLRAEFIDGCEERLNTIDSLIHQLITREGDLQQALLELQRDVHSLKGTAGTHGFPAMTRITHRMEDYLQNVGVLDETALNNLQKFSDALRKIAEERVNPSEADTAAILRALPVDISNFEATGPSRAVAVVLVMPASVQRKIVQSELSSCGFQVITASDGTGALAEILAAPPEAVILSQELPDVTGADIARALRAMKKTAKTRIVLATSHAADSQRVAGLPDGITVIQKSKTFAEDLGATLMDWGLFGNTKGH